MTNDPLGHIAGPAALASAGSGDLFHEGEMRLIGARERRADAFGQFAGGEQAGGLDHLALAVDPLGLGGIEPGALDGQGAGHDPDAAAAVPPLSVVLADPAADVLAQMPGGVVPDQEERRL